MSAADFDLHGVVGVRLLDADAHEAAAVGAQLGAAPCAPERDPEVVVRFVPRLDTPGLRYVEVGRSGFTDDGFFVLRHRRRRVCVRLPLDRAAGPFEVVCERGARSVPFLDALLKVVALEKGYVPVHASAFEHEGAGVLVAGWAHGGKTSALLAFAAVGAAFVSDDVVLLGADGRRMLGVAAPLSVSDWQLEQLPRAWECVPLSRRIFFAGVHGLDRVEAGGGRGARLVRGALPALHRRLKVQLPPEAVFGRVGAGGTELRTVFLAFSHPDEEIRVEPADPDEVAERLAASLRHELLALSAQYLAYRFAFPRSAEDPLPALLDRAALLLRRALADKDVFVVRHPHPVRLWDLYAAMHPHVARAAAAV